MTIAPGRATVYTAEPRRAPLDQFTACAAAALAALAAFAPAHAQQDNRIGVLLDTGDPSDARMLEAMRAAARDFNLARDPDRFQVELQLYKMDHGSGLEAVREAHAGGGPPIYVGLTRDDDALGVAKYLASNRLAAISPSSSAGSARGQDGTMFRLTAPAHVEVAALAGMIHESGARTAVVAVRQGVFGTPDLGDAQQWLGKYRITVGAVEEFPAGGSDLGPALERLDSALSANPGAALLVMGGADSDVASMAHAASGYAGVESAPWFVQSGAIYPEEGAPAPGVSITVLVKEVRANGATDRIDSLLRGAGYEPSVHDYSAYDSVLVAAAALETAGGGSLHERVPAAALAASGALGEIKFDEYGDLASPALYGVWQSSGGAWSRSGDYDHQKADCPSLELVPVAKNSDGSVACVLPITANMLGERGWGTPLIEQGLLGRIYVGNLVPLGGEPGRGAASLEAAEMAVWDFNNYLKTLDDERWILDLFTLDTAGGPDVAMLGAENVRSAGITALADHHGDRGARAVKEYADRNGMMAVSCCSTAPELAVAGDSLYRMMPDDTREPAALLAVLEHHGIESAVVAWRGDEWGDRMAGAWKDAAGQTGYREVRYDPDSPGSAARELASQVRRASGEAGADRTAVVLLGSSEAAGIVEASTAYPDLALVRWYGAGAAGESVGDLTSGGFLESVRFTVPGAHAPPGRVFYEVLEKLPGNPTGYADRAFVHASYEAVWLLGLSMLEAGSSEGAELRRAISGAADGRQGAVGDATLNAAGDAARSAYDIWETADGGRHLAGTYEGGKFFPAPRITLD